MSRIEKTVFPVNGQGTLIYTIKHKSEFTIYITPDKQKIPSEIVVDDDNECEEESFQTDNYISLTVGDHVAKFNLKMKKDGEDEFILEQLNAMNIEEDSTTKSEMSLKKEHGRKFGIEPDKLVSLMTWHI